MKNKGKKSLLLFGILPVLSSAAAVYFLMTLPFVRYQYKRKTYLQRGRMLLSGSQIGEGSIQIPPNAVLWLLLISLIVIIVFSLLRGRMNEKWRSQIAAIASVVSLVSIFVASSNLPSFFDGVKKVTGAEGIPVIAVCCILNVIFGLIDLRQNKILCALDFMILPGMLYFVINNYIPMFGIYIAFKKIDYGKGLWGSDWVGLDNFKYLFSTSDAFTITRNTILYNVAFIVLGIVSGIVVGICLSSVYNKLMQKTYQTTILLPQLISYVIVSYIVFAFLSNESGLITKALANPINFYAEKKYWPFILIFISIWKQLGYNGIVFLSSIVGINNSIYEAARVDGAGKWQQILFITLPQLKPTIMTLFLLQVGRIFYSDFGLFYQVPLNAGALMDVTNTIDTYVYRALMVNNNISIASAASTYQAVVGFVIVFAVNMLVRKVDRENALF